MLNIAMGIRADCVSTLDILRSDAFAMKVVETLLIFFVTYYKLSSFYQQSPPPFPSLPALPLSRRLRRLLLPRMRSHQRHVLHLPCRLLLIRLPKPL